MTKGQIAMVAAMVNKEFGARWASCTAKTPEDSVL
jgi:hypothetical protein